MNPVLTTWMTMLVALALAIVNRQRPI